MFRKMTVYLSVNPAQFPVRIDYHLVIMISSFYLFILPEYSYKSSEFIYAQTENPPTIIKSKYLCKIISTITITWIRVSKMSLSD